MKTLQTSGEIEARGLINLHTKRKTITNQQGHLYLQGQEGVCGVEGQGEEGPVSEDPVRAREEAAKLVGVRLSGQDRGIAAGGWADEPRGGKTGAVRAASR